MFIEFKALFGDDINIEWELGVTLIARSKNMRSISANSCQILRNLQLCYENAANFVLLKRRIN